MKIHLLLFSILLLVGSQAALPFLPNGPFEGYKAYLRGVCAATGADCDLTALSSCWDYNSAAVILNMMYQGCVGVINSPPSASSDVLKAHFIDDFSKHASSIVDTLNCDKNTPYARQVSAKISKPGEGIDGVITNIVYYASVRPEDTSIILKNLVALAEQGNFEAFGLVAGNFMLQASILKQKEDSDWHKNAKNGRRLILRGICESLALDCPMDSLNALDEEDSSARLQLLYEWFKSVATLPIATGAQNGIEFYSRKVKEVMDQISQEAIGHDKNSVGVKLISEKLGFDPWSAEWVEAVLTFMKEFLEISWHYKVSEYQLFENNDLEGVGIVLGLDYYHVASWNLGKLEKAPTSATDL